MVGHLVGSVLDHPNPSHTRLERGADLPPVPRSLTHAVTQRTSLPRRDMQSGSDRPNAWHDPWKHDDAMVDAACPGQFDGVGPKGWDDDDALVDAAEHGLRDVVEVLLHRGADPNAANCELFDANYECTATSTSFWTFSHTHLSSTSPTRAVG